MPNWLTHTLDILSKAALPACVAGIAYLTYASTHQDAQERMLMDQISKKKEAEQKDVALRQKNDELEQKKQEMLFKVDEQKRAHETLQANFVEKHIDLISNPVPDAIDTFSALARAELSPADADSVIGRVKDNRKGLTASLIGTDANAPEKISAYYKQQGLKSLKTKDFDGAYKSFLAASIADGTDAEVWDIRAHTALITKRLDDAFYSIGHAIDLKPGDPKLQINVAINATKILCARNTIQDAQEYFSRAAVAIPSFSQTAQSDAELKSYCGFN